MLLLVLRHTPDLSHAVTHLGKMAFGVAVILALMIVLPRLAIRAHKSGPQKKRHSGGFNRQQRRQERAIKRKL